MFTIATRPALHAPLSNAVEVVISIMPRQVRQMNFSNLIAAQKDA
jgi:hypothetical protein